MQVKCPNCGGVLLYDPATGLMKCESCGELTPISVPERGSRDAAQSDAAQEVKPKKLSMKGGSPGAVPPHMAESTAGAGSTAEDKRADDGFTDPDRAYRPEELRLGWLKRSHKDISEYDAGVGGYSEETEKPVDDDDYYMEIETYHCESCGARLMMYGSNATKVCSFCGKQSIIFDEVKNELRPDSIIPFKITEEHALRLIQKEYGDKKRRRYMSLKVDDISVEDIRGVYVPFWLYTGYVRRFVTYGWSESGKHHTYHRTNTYENEAEYECVPHDASLSLDNDMSKYLEPFNMKERVPFKPEYIAGYYADIYDVPADSPVGDMSDRFGDMNTGYMIKSMLENYPSRANEEIIGQFDNMIGEENTCFRLKEVEYALLPVYFVTFDIDGRIFPVLVNGQTGKVVGNVPTKLTDVKRQLVKNIALYTLLFAALMLMFVLLLGGGGPIFFVIGEFAILGLSAMEGYRHSKKRYDEMTEKQQKMSSSQTMSYITRR